jgi:predicted enzyme related to lactoylglutathione lyase
MDVLSSRTIIHPSDLDRSLAFYGDVLGLPVAREFGEGSGRGVVFFAGGGFIEVTGGPAPARASKGGHDSMVLWLQVRSVVTVLDELTGRGVVPVRKPTLEPWGLIEAWIDDPDGIRIHLVEVPSDHPLRRDIRQGLAEGEPA